MTGTALATGSGAGPSGDLRVVGAAGPGNENTAADRAAADRAAGQQEAAAASVIGPKASQAEPEHQPAPQAAAHSEPGNEPKAEAKAKAEPAKAAKPAVASTGSAAGAASGKSAAQATAQAAAQAAAPSGKAGESSRADSSSNPGKHGTPTSGPLSKPQPLSNADRNGTGANPGNSCTHAYCSTRDGSASGNGVGDGVGDGNAVGKPCAGCVGKADNKNPKGQAPNGSDHNAGYECDRNQGIGKTNPAHTGCKSGTPTTPPTSPKDACPGMPGNQAPGTVCTPKGNDKDNGADKVTICHATGSSTNPYVIISPSKKGVLNGHVGSSHQGGRDIIPPFSYKDGNVTRTFPGQGDQSLLGRGCTVPGSRPNPPPVGPPTGVNPPPTGGGGTVVVPPSTPIGGVTPNQPATRPVPVGPPTKPAPVRIVPNAAVPISVITPGGATPATLPFTGTDTMLLIGLGAVLLLAGGGVLHAARPARTRQVTA